MLNLTSRELTQYARDTGFLKNEFEKAIRLLGVLRELTHHLFLQRCFVLKGGTALNLFVYDISRLSVDIDLNYVRTVDKSQMEKDREDIARIVPSLFSSEYEVRPSKDEYALLQYEFRYQTVSRSRDMLKLDINFLHRLPMMPTDQFTFRKFGQSLGVTMSGLEELLAAKVVTLLSRYTPRDLFDIYQATMSKPLYDSELLRSLILYFALISRMRVQELYRPKWNQVSDYDIRRQLHPLLMRKRFPEREEMISRASAFLEPFLLLEQKEDRAISVFYATGDLDLSVLFTQKELQKRINRSPAMAWKIGNIKKHVAV